MVIVLHLTRGRYEGNYRSDDPEHGEFVKRTCAQVTAPESNSSDPGTRQATKWSREHIELGNDPGTLHMYVFREVKQFDDEIHIYMEHEKATKLPPP